MKAAFACLLTMIAICSAAHASPTLDAVRARGKLACGVVTEGQDWNKEDLHGNLSALGTEICRAVAIATLGRQYQLDVVGFPAEEEALAGLNHAKVDVVVGLTPSATRTLQYGVVFGPPVFWDTQTFMVHHALGVTSATGLAGKTVCYIDGTDNGGVLLATMQSRGIRILPFPFQEEGEMDAGLVGGHCRAISAYASKMAEIRTQFHALVHDFVLLPDTLAVSPANIATRQGDAGWTAIADTTVQVLVQAEMLGITRANLAVRRAGEDPVTRHLLGTDWSAGLSLGLARDFSAQIVAALGNYGEVFDRTVGEGSPLGLKRGLNATCLQGGAMCASPVR